MSPSSGRPIAQIALPVALAQPLAYRIPRDLEGVLRPGHRVAVPLRGRTARGFVIALCRPGDPGYPPAKLRLKEISGLDPEQVLLEQPLLDLVRWVADYYIAPVGMACEAAVPRAVARPPRKCPPRGADIRREAHVQLNADQQLAAEGIRGALARPRATTFLLYGVTGSGKTEVYLQAAQACLDAGRQVLILVPEIAIGTLVVERVRERFGSLVAEYHSQMPPAARRAAWWDAHDGRARVVVGARSAVFAPLPDLGLIVVDEEHEPSYKQGEAPRYHGRDTALMRAYLENAVAILGSATPSLESRANAARGKYELLRLPARVRGRPRPSVTLVDLRGVPPSGSPDPGGLPVVTATGRDPQEPLSRYLVDCLQAVLDSGDQAILFLNRRGFATSVQCRDCGHLFSCPQCSVVLTHHRREGRLRCHYCNHTVSEIATCPDCAGTDFAFRGVGTQRVEEALARQVPGARVLRMDADSTRRRGALTAIINAFDSGAADILLGTQMVAKGFDFPRVTLVGVINADREMSFPDFRGQERAFQLLTQVAGRAGRGAKAGQVIFQTYLPEHHVIQAAGRQDYDFFYASEIAERDVFGFPPHRRIANLLFDGPDEEAVVRRARGAADRLAGNRRVTQLGPAPMPLSRLKGQFRWHLTLLADGPGALGQALRGAIGGPGGRVRVQVDMDPVSML